MAIVAAGVATAAYLALGLVGGRLAAAVAVAAVVFVAFEVAVVSVLALASLVPVAEDDGPGLFGRLMGAIAVGNAVGAVLAPVLFARGGIVVVGVGVGAGLAAFAGVIVLSRGTATAATRPLGRARSQTKSRRSSTSHSSSVDTPAATASLATPPPAPTVIGPRISRATRGSSMNDPQTDRLMRQIEVLPAAVIRLPMAPSHTNT